MNEIVSGVGETLKRLEKVAKKYDILGSSSRRRQIWAKIKWSVEFSKIDSLRNKVGSSIYLDFLDLSIHDSVFIS